MKWYKEYAIEKIENEKDIPQWEEESNQTENLLLNVPLYGVDTDGTLEETYFTEYYNTPEEKCKLTDGIKCEKLDFNDNAFTHFSRGVGRTAVFRLPALSAVKKINIGFLRQDGVAIYLPRRCDILFSPDGIKYQRVFKERNLRTSDTPAKYELKAEFEKPIKTLYIVIEFDVASHIWIDQIEAFGTKSTKNAVDIIPEAIQAEAPIRYVNKYPEYSDFCDVHNLLLSYNCVTPERVGDNKSGYVSVEQYLPYVGYYNKNGEMVDTFFDSFLYLPYSVYTYSKLYKCADGWNYYVDNVFADDYNLDALSKAAGIAGEKLGIDDYKVKVFFSILHTKVGYGEYPEKFGDLDGDGVDEDFSTLEDRKKAVKWIIDVQMEKYKAKEYPHTVCEGFYWFEEQINYSDEFELDLLAFARDYVHSLGLKLFWIPYFQAVGFQDWKENGFDIACMQPNYAFRKVSPQVLYNNAEITKKLGMCVEMEIGGIDEEHIEKFKCYMDAGAETGYMNTIKMYYQGGVPGEFYRSYKAEDELTRSVYDDVYLFAKEKYVSRKLR